MKKYSNLTFEWKHIDEVVLYFANPSKIQLKIEIFKIFIPFLIIIFILWILFLYKQINLFIFLLIFWIFFLFLSFSVIYKIYRTKKNYIYITSKRIIFYGINWLFKDYVKKINYENIRNINYFTESFFWKIFNYWALEIQSSHWWVWDIMLYHMEYWKMLAHYIDKLVSITKEERLNFPEFNPNYFNN